jgi:phage terminase large subunit
MKTECETGPNGKHVFLPNTSSCAYCGRGGIVVGDDVLYVPTDKGLEYHYATQPNVLLWGGRGSGKSTIGRWDAHMRALAYPGFKYIILRRTFPELQKSHLIHIQKEMKLLGGTFNYTDKIAKYPNGSTGFFSHCAEEADVLNLLSAEFYLAFFDELSTFDWEMFTKLAASVRVPVNSNLIAMVRAATNPLGASAEKLIQYFVDKTVDVDEDPDYVPTDWHSIKANLEDNPHLDREQYKKRFSGLPAHVRRAWVDGEFAIENALFDFKPRREGKPWHVIDDLDLPKILKYARVYRAIDLGWFPDPTVVLWIAHLGNRYIVFNEFVDNQIPIVDLAQIIKDEDKRLGVTNVVNTYIDPTMDLNTSADLYSNKQKLENLGIACECSVNNRELYATVMHNTLAEQADESTPRIQFYKNGQHGCPYLVKTIPQMRYDLKRPRFMADHKDDHAVVACCYFLMTSASMEQRSIGGHSTAIRPWMKPKLPERFKRDW